ncbi:AAA family ATPase [Methylocaldum szegediense]|uniref:AAA family ATPase n=1 Tax=Methylocaldum szegediense TaxID=73780 RepID=UPI00040FF137|nr:AAA family ATPase [Methylocaldum szegediense]
MRLSRIRIEQFKKFRQPIEIKDLEPGLNLFTGPNEAGKSTIVSAIRAAFFERHRSGSVDDLRPWGDTSASPTVELEFAIGDTHYRLIKSFLGKKRCELQIGAQRLDSAEAEDHLAELLGFRYAGRGASGSEHWGIPGLLWIQQGAGHDIRDSVTHAMDHLRTALNASLGEIASSSGDSVLATVEAARNELLTPSTGKPRGAYAEAIDQEAELANAIRELDSEIAAYRQKVDTLAALRREHAADEAEKPWIGFRTQERAAAEKLEEIQRIEEALSNEKRRAAELDERIKLLHGQLETFARQEKELETREAELESIRQKLERATALVQEWQSKRAEAEARHEAARETLRLARQADTRLKLMRELEATRLKVKEAADTLEKAEKEQVALVELKRQAALTEIKLKDLEQLRKQDRQIREMQIRLATAATRLRFTLEDGRSIGIGDESVTGTGERLLLETTTLTLPGLGQLEIAPGGSDLTQLRTEAKQLIDTYEALLQRLGLPSLEAAEARYRAYTQHLADIKTAEATLKALAPQGIEPLRTEVAVQRARVQELEQALNLLPPETPQTAKLPSVSEAEAAEEAARLSLEKINESLHEAQLAAGKEQTAFETATRELAAARAVVDDPQRPERVAAANRDLVEARAEQSTLAGRIETLSRQLAEARPDILKQDVERFRRSAEQLEKRFNERRDQLVRLQVELQTAGAKGLEERRAELARDHAQTKRRLEELRRRAEALDYLLRLLRDKRRALTQKLQAPLQKHLSRYLQLLFPGASLDIDENLSPRSLTRNGSNGTELGDFEDLSFGAREQMGIISRLAYAGLLREAGRPTLIILDDALVHSDEERLAQMKRVLFDAATRHQILLFSCHPAKWRDLGVGARSLETIRAEA